MPAEGSPIIFGRLLLHLHFLRTFDMLFGLDKAFQNLDSAPHGSAADLSEPLLQTTLAGIRAKHNLQMSTSVRAALFFSARKIRSCTAPRNPSLSFQTMAPIAHPVCANAQFLCTL